MKQYLLSPSLLATPEHILLHVAEVEAALTERFVEAR